MKIPIFTPEFRACTLHCGCERCAVTTNSQSDYSVRCNKARKVGGERKRKSDVHHTFFAFFFFPLSVLLDRSQLGIDYQTNGASECSVGAPRGASILPQKCLWDGLTASEPPPHHTFHTSELGDAVSDISDPSGQVSTLLLF